MDDYLQRVQMQQQMGPITDPAMMQTTQESEAVMAPSMMEQMLQQEASESGSYSWKSGREADLQYLGKGRVGDFSGLQGTTIEEVLSRIPEAAGRRELIPIEGKVTEGFEYKWTQEGKTYRVRIHGTDASAPAGSNAANGWVVRVQQGKKYDDISDLFEYGNISDEEVIKFCNHILLKSKEEKNDMVLEAMYHAVFTAANCRDISNQLEIDSILDVINNFNQEISDYIISILAYTGNRKYISTIKSIGEKYEDLDISEAIEELESRC